MTLTPEAEVSSTVTTSNSFCDSDQSNGELKVNATLSGCSIPTVIPPTTIVCLPSLVTVPNSIPHQSANVQSTYISSPNTNNTTAAMTQKPCVQSQSQQQQQQPLHNIYTNNNIQRPSVSLSLPPSTALHHRTAVVASSSSLPYLSLATTQPLRAVPQTSQSRLKAPVKGGRGSRTNSNRPPPGAVNLERSYQICQAVIQNSPNRHQLKAQLRPPPSMLGSTNVTNNNIKKDENLPSTKQMVCQRVAFSAVANRVFFAFFFADDQCSGSSCLLEEKWLCATPIVASAGTPCIHHQPRYSRFDGSATVRDASAKLPRWSARFVTIEFNQSNGPIYFGATGRHCFDRKSGAPSV